jgi:streptogramin lyase
MRAAFLKANWRQILADQRNLSEGLMLKLRTLLSFAIIFLGFAAALSFAAGALAGLPAVETPLNPAGQAYEINRDPRGILWISDYDAGEVRRIDPVTGNHIAYPVGGGPSDARSEGDGFFWWVDAQFNQVGRLSEFGGSASLWTIPGSIGLYGSGLGSSGDIWVTDLIQPYLYHLMPSLSASELCTYTLPADGVSDYLLVSGGQVWLGDWQNSRILRLDVTGEQFTGWDLPTGSRPLGMSLDGSGNLWWADPTQGWLARLAPVPGASQVITYTQPGLVNPTMLTLVDEKVWYSEPTRVGILDPARIAKQSTGIDSASYPGVPNCDPLADPVTTPIATAPGSASWSQANYASIPSPAGWQVFQLPTGASAWGIAATADNIWLVDQGRQLLAKLPKKAESLLYIPLVMR